ncbi:MAG: hypothetical protein SFU83_23725 [Meiothermus sp.]|nr:hypothetical protein [Meiothermus sp.]
MSGVFVNNHYYDWGHITTKLLGQTLVDYKAIEYGDEMAVEPVYGKGRKPRGWRRGRYGGKDGVVRLLREEYDALLASPQVQEKGLYGLDPFEITVTGDKGNGSPFTDVLEGVVFFERDFENVQEDGDEMTVPLGIKYLNVRSGDQEPFAGE